MTSKIAQKYNDQALQLQSRYAQEAGAVSGNPRLSASGKKEALAGIWLQARNDMDSIRAVRRTELEQEQVRLKRQLFGLSSVEQLDPAKVSLMRDSIDRAVRYGDEKQATSALRAAHRAGDTSLVKAIVSTAFDQSWFGLVDQYIELEPDQYGKLSELHAISRDVDSTDQAQAMYEAMTMTIEKPSELSGVPLEDVRALAAGEYIAGS